MADEIAKGVNTLKHLPPIALGGILVVGIGGVLYIRSRKGAQDTSGETVDAVQAVPIQALERGPIGSLPQSYTPANGSPDAPIVPPPKHPQSPPPTPIPPPPPPP